MTGQRDDPQLALFAPDQASAPFAAPPPVIRVAGRVLQPTVVFGTYWRFAAERQRIYMARLAGQPGPWTVDPVLRAHRFTNVYRVTDRTSQDLLRVQYAGPQDPEEIVFRTLLFKFFNTAGTWDLLQQQASLGELTWAGFDAGACDRVLTAAAAAGQRLYSAAYIMPPPPFGAARKHTNHLRLLQHMMTSGLTRQVTEAKSLSEVYAALLAYPSIGPFLGFQLATDLNYAVTDFSEMEFAVAGPGARDGIAKCFGAAAAGLETQVIRYMAEHQDEHFARLGLQFDALPGRPLQLIDCQNIFCEVSKYARVAHPEVHGPAGRTRIKQRYTPMAAPVTAWFPPKWHLPPLQGTPR